jgi:hypothetical protein
MRARQMLGLLAQAVSTHRFGSIIWVTLVIMGTVTSNFFLKKQNELAWLPMKTTGELL